MPSEWKGPLVRWECYDCRSARQASRRKRWHGRWYELANAADWYLEKHLERYDCNPKNTALVDSQPPKPTTPTPTPPTI